MREMKWGNIVCGIADKKTETQEDLIGSNNWEIGKKLEVNIEEQEISVIYKLSMKMKTMADPIIEKLN